MQEVHSPPIEKKQAIVSRIKIMADLDIAEKRRPQDGRIRVKRNSHVIDYSYDPNGNLTSLTPPGRPAHTFGHTPVNLTRFYGPPELSDGTGNTLYFIIILSA
jgi:hypothetical protein